MAYLYILYSEVLLKYYVGSTHGTIEERLRRHLSDHHGFTGKSKDWKVVYFEYYEEFALAYKREHEIKAWKSKVRIKKLILNQNDRVNS